MNLIPAIDLKDNKCVRLVKGDEKLLTIFNENPLEQAKIFEREGCKRIHIVDLDGAFGRHEVNKETILKISKEISIPIELGGGIKSESDILFWLENGINYLILGSLAIINQKLITDISKKFKNKIYVAMDIFNDRVMIKGWLEDSGFDYKELFQTYNNSDIKGYILTDIARDGMLQGLDLPLINKILAQTRKPLIVGGGLSNYTDLKELKKIDKENLEGVIVGKAYYSGSINIKKSLEILL